MTKPNSVTQDRTDSSSHVKILARWRELRKTIYELPKDSDEECAAQEYLEALGVQHCNTPAKTTEDLVAQIAWLKEDFGAYQQMFEVLAEGDLSLRAADPGCSHSDQKWLKQCLSGVAFAFPSLALTSSWRTIGRSTVEGLPRKEWG